VLSEIHDFLMADLKEQRICEFCFKLGKTASETYEMLKTAFGDNAMGGKNRLLNGFHISDLGKLWFMIVSIEVITPQVSQTKAWRKFAKLSVKCNEAPCQRLLVS
jgi:hypothetical protein